MAEGRVAEFNSVLEDGHLTIHRGSDNTFLLLLRDAQGDVAAVRFLGDQAQDIFDFLMNGWAPKENIRA